jgi:hypothetical protein
MGEVIALFATAPAPGESQQDVCDLLEKLLERARLGEIKERADSFEMRISAIAGRFARGSIALQTDHALTETRLNNEREALAKKRA